MKKLLIAAALACLIGGASLASANPAHHAGPTAGSAHGAPMKCGKHRHQHGHAMRCKHGSAGMQGMSGMHDGGMMGKGGMDHEHMQQMHDHMGQGGMSGGGMMHDGAMGSGGMMNGAHPSATPTPTAPK